MAANPDLLTASDIDTFTRKLKSTLALAEEAQKLKAFVGQLSGLVGGAAPRAARAAATREAAAPAKRGASRPARRGGKSSAVAPEAVLAAIKESNGGMSIGSLVQKLGAKKPRVFATLKGLRDEKKVKVVGEKRAAKWMLA